MCSDRIYFIRKIEIGSVTDVLFLVCLRLVKAVKESMEQIVFKSAGSIFRRRSYTPTEIMWFTLGGKAYDDQLGEDNAILMFHVNMVHCRRTRSEGLGRWTASISG